VYIFKNSSFYRTDIKTYKKTKPLINSNNVKPPYFNTLKNMIKQILSNVYYIGALFDF